tara:strand:+ start:1957 stop:2154 length:198 start_codon:yes stop_codon:yes gene_type:complete
MKAVGIRRIYYSTGNGDEIIFKNINDIENLHISVGDAVVEYYEITGIVCMTEALMYRKQKYGQLS